MCAGAIRGAPIERVLASGARALRPTRGTRASASMQATVSAQDRTRQLPAFGEHSINHQLHVRTGGRLPLSNSEARVW
jgi:hypothetical protein